MNEIDKPPEPDEEYALERFAKLTDEERKAMTKGGITTDAEIIATLRDEFWEELDHQSGHIELENAEIESSLIAHKSKH